MKGEEVLVLDVRNEVLGEGGHDMLAKHEPVMGNRHGLAVHRDDRWIVAAALKGEADVLVTGHSDILLAVGAEGFQVFTPRGF